MREFIYFSNKARTSGNFNDLMEAGRIDIAIHSFINAFFESNFQREDVVFHFIFYGPPTPPRHLEFHNSKKAPISKKDLAGLIKRMLYKYKEARKTEVFPGCFIEKKNLKELIEEMQEQGREVYVLDEKGEDIANINLKGNEVFLIADQEGFPQKELKRLKKNLKAISLGKTTYFASHVITILNYLIDRKNQKSSNF